MQPTGTLSRSPDGDLKDPENGKGRLKAAPTTVATSGYQLPATSYKLIFPVL
jgi:hypothetical protein